MRWASDYLKRTDYKIYYPGLETDMKLSIFGDTHISKLVTKGETLSLQREIAKQKADYIFGLGDFIDTPKELDNKEKREQTLALFKACGSLAPTMLVLGGHDYVEETKNMEINAYNEEFWQQVANLDNVHLLNNRTYYDNKVFVMGYFQKMDYYYNLVKVHKEDGLSVYNDLKPRRVLYENLPDNVPKIGLFHSPDYLLEEENVNLLCMYDLLLSGHEHNGCIPALLDDLWSFHSGLINPKKKLFPTKVVRGLQTLSSGTKLLVSGGMVKIQDCAPRILQPLDKLCYRQMDTITLTGDDQNKVYQKENHRIYFK